MICRLKIKRRFFASFLIFLDVPWAFFAFLHFFFTFSLLFLAFSLFFSTALRISSLFFVFLLLHRHSFTARWLTRMPFPSNTHTCALAINWRGAIEQTAIADCLAAEEIRTEQKNKLPPSHFHFRRQTNKQTKKCTFLFRFVSSHGGLESIF